jgi:tetratricopeptide (TPR) repeat protein
VVRGADLSALPAGRTRVLRWAAAAPAVAAIERAQDHARALARYCQIHAEPDEHTALHTAIARCHLQLGHLGDAVDHARRALRDAPADPEANRIAVDALWRADRIAQALDAADAWLAAAPDAALAHYARGRALLRLRRLFESRQALDRACLLGPALIEAMVLRREAARALAALRDAVGTAAARTLDVPAQLVEVRDLVATGRLADAICVLQRAEHAADPDALLVLGHLLGFGARFAEALDAFEAAARCGAGHVARLARACTLLEFDRPGLALAAFDDVLAERPDLGDAREGRAVALKRLGRDAEAEAAFRLHLAAIARAAELRVRSADR